MIMLANCICILCRNNLSAIGYIVVNKLGRHHLLMEDSCVLVLLQWEYSYYIFNQGWSKVINSGGLISQQEKFLW